MTHNFIWGNIHLPNTSNELLGNEENIVEIRNFLNNLKQKKNISNCICLYGSIGIGKNLIINLLLKESNFTKTQIDFNYIKNDTMLIDKINEVTNTNIVNIFKKSKNSIIIQNFIPKKNKLDIILNYSNKNKYIPVIFLYNDIKNLNILKNINKVHISTLSFNNMKILLINLSQKINIILNDECLDLLCENCNNNLNRALFIIENIKIHFKEKKIDVEKLKTQLHIFSSKDLDIDTFSMYEKSFQDILSYDDSINFFENDMNGYLLIQENIYNNLNSSNLTEKKTLKIINDYYDKLIDASIFEQEIYTKKNWYMSEYIAILTIKFPNYLINKNNIIIKKLNTNNYTIISKMNYYYCNLKHINNICKQLNLSYSTFQYFTVMLYEKFILNNYEFKIPNMNFYCFDKCIKLSYLHTKYYKLYTKKKQNKFKTFFN